MRSDQWAWSADHRQACRVIETQELWGERVARVWLPGRDEVVCVKADSLAPLDSPMLTSPAYIRYLAAAARVKDALTQNVLLAPIESAVVPLPHQIRALSRAVSERHVRYLLADEVGLGKTIEAGLIMRELKLRGLVRRVLVVAPTGLVPQWVAEMRARFNEEFHQLIPRDFYAHRLLTGEENIWRARDQVVTPMDSVKPVDGRRGWSDAELAHYNRERFEDLVAAGWDLVIVDEAHRLGGSSEAVARHRLGLGLADAAPYLLLLSATPHQGKTDAFHRLVSLLDEEAFPDESSVSRERIAPYVIRTEKRRAINAEGEPLFTPRETTLVTVSWNDRHALQRELYEAVTEYVRAGYNRAMEEKNRHVGFLMVLMQRLVTSSTSAIRATLERRTEVLDSTEQQLGSLRYLSQEEWADMDGQEQLETLLGARLEAVGDEKDEVGRLLELARRAESAGVDAKAEALLDRVYRLQQEEGDPELKVLIFTEFVATQEMLRRFLEERGFAVAVLNGAMDADERVAAQEEFAGEARVLVSTDAGGEGLNLQFCHVVANFDLPWNPMRVEQRIGRVDRIGQEHPVRALNFVLADTVEYRVREVLEEKLAVIFEEYGVDKTGDVLDSARAGELFEETYVKAIMDPAEAERRVNEAVEQVRREAGDTRERKDVLGTAEPLDPDEARSLMSHPLPHWVETMTVSYLEAHGGRAERDGQLWNLAWPTGETLDRVAFVESASPMRANQHRVSLEHPLVRALVEELPQFVDGQRVPGLSVAGLPPAVSGVWSLWLVGLSTTGAREERVLPLFKHDDGRSLAPTARMIWDRVLAGEFRVEAGVEGEDPARARGIATAGAKTQGGALYAQLSIEHRDRITREREKAEHAFAARRRAIERLGLPAVRQHRLAELEAEERERFAEIDAEESAMPFIVPALVARVRGNA